MASCKRLLPNLPETPRRARPAETSRLRCPNLVLNPTNPFQFELVFLLTSFEPVQLGLPDETIAKDKSMRIVSSYSETGILTQKRGDGSQTPPTFPRIPRRLPMGSGRNILNPEPRIVKTKCPKCGLELALPPVYEEVDCPRCGAHLARRNDEEEDLKEVAEEPVNTEAEAEEKWRRDNPEC